MNILSFEMRETYQKGNGPECPAIISIPPYLKPLYHARTTYHEKKTRSGKILEPCSDSGPRFRFPIPVGSFRCDTVWRRAVVPKAMGSSENGPGSTRKKTVGRGRDRRSPPPPFFFLGWGRTAHRTRTLCRRPAMAMVAHQLCDGCEH